MTKMTDTAAIAAIGAATRELHLPAVRTEAERLAEVARASQRPTWPTWPRCSPPRSTTGPSAAASAGSTRPASRGQATGRLRLLGRPPVDAGDHRLLGIGRPTWTRASPWSCSATRARASAICSSGWAWRHANRAARVRYATCAQLVNELVEAADERRLSRIVARYGRLDLLCLDELGYVQLDARGAELSVPDPDRTRREGLGRRGLEPPVQRMGQVIPDPRLVAAIVDRLTFNAHIIETGTDCYRLRTTRARTRRKT